MPGKTAAALLLVLMCLFGSRAFAQTAGTGPAGTVSAIFLSDIHLDPYADPGKVARLNGAPAAEWGAILAAPGSEPNSGAVAKLKLTCPVRGTDTPDALWRSSLAALRAQAAATHPKFVTVSGDLLAHSFDCKFHALLPEATDEQYAAFTEKTVRYVLTGLKAAIPGTPIYLALGNNDSACKDYQLAPKGDVFLGLVAKIAAEVLPEADRPAVLATYADSGSFVAPLAGVPETRMIVLDDMFLSASYAACGGGKDPAPGAAEIAWLKAQLEDARAHKEKVWVMAHIPPSIDLYNTARRLTDVCAGGRPVMFLGSDALRETLAAYADVIRLALFGHTHNDEMELIAPEGEGSAGTGGGGGVPVKLTASISPVNGNRPTFTVAWVDPRTATLKDFAVWEASNGTGVGTTWAKEYTYSAVYREAGFDGASVSRLISEFQGDPGAEKETSKAYLRNYFPGDMSGVIRAFWPEYACSMDHQTAAGFAGCVCKK